jgi:hypothetical protein
LRKSSVLKSYRADCYENFAVGGAVEMFLAIEQGLPFQRRLQTLRQCFEE